MLVVVDVDPTLYDEAQRFAAGRYRDLDQFLEVAIRNQIALETKGRRVLDCPAPTEPPLVTQDASHSLAGSSDPAALDWRRLVRRITTEPAPLTRLGPAQTDAVLWGQLNRLLPTALGVRVLANLLVESSATTIELATWHAAAAEVAIAWGVQLQRMDREAERRRGDLWATAFPRDDRTSSRRYVAQFLGSPSRSAPLGNAEILGFVDFVTEDALPLVGLTTGGVQWASLENPIFDGADPIRTFSVLEARFFLEHLQSHLPDEYRFMTLVADLIHRGYDRPALDRKLAQAYPDWAAYAATMRAGVIGRLHDLGLLHRIRKGQRVEYALSDLAYDLALVTHDEREIGGVQ